jgi:ABC-type uncharacterized transport system substrate-binding protein
MKRRQFIRLLGGAAVAWPLAARAQPREAMRSIGVLMNLSAEDAVARARIGAFKQRLQQLGWTEGGNLRIEYRWTAGSDDELSRSAAELVALAPEIIMATGSPPVVALRKATRTVPIVFALVHVERGGLIAYAPDQLDQYRRAAIYVDRILKGEKPADLPVQAPTKYELVINLKTAKALGLEIPPTLLARADEVIE